MLNENVGRDDCLHKDENTLSVQGIISHLSQDIHKNVIVYDSLESTNITAKKLAKSGAEHGTVIIADHQSTGKGRHGRSFYSPSGCGLYMSFILHPDRFHFNTPTLITAYAAVAVCEAIESVTDKAPKIKWVNDIFLGDKKICGILTESVIDPGSSAGSVTGSSTGGAIGSSAGSATESNTVNAIRSSAGSAIGSNTGDNSGRNTGGSISSSFAKTNTSWILGTGINFYTPPNGFPEDLQHTAGSLFDRTYPVGLNTITRNQLAAYVIDRILFTGSNRTDIEIISEYKRRMFLLGKAISVSGVEEAFDATAVDIDDFGRLIVRDNSGKLISLSAGDVSIKNIF